MWRGRRRDAPTTPRKPVTLDACWGREIHTQAGCVSCHSTDPAVNAPGPSWARSFGTTRALEGGTRILVDAAYIRRSILTPQEETAHGYTVTMMNPYRLSDRQIRAITEYIESLAAPEPAVVETQLEARRTRRRRSR